MAKRARGWWKRDQGMAEATFPSCRLERVESVEAAVGRRYSARASRPVWVCAPDEAAGCEAPVN